MRLGSIEGASGIGSIEANSQLTAKGIAEPSAAPSSAPISATIMNSMSASADDAGSGRANRFENGERRALALDETLRRVRHADAADDQRQQSRERQKLGEAVEIATEVRVDGETRASVPSGLREGPLRLIHESLDGGIVRRPFGPSMTTRVVHRTSEPGCTSLVASRAACEMSTRGPRPTPVASRSGSLVRTVRRAKLASPMRTTSPSFRLSRASSASSTAAPNIPSRSPSASSKRHGRREDRLADARP